MRLSPSATAIALALAPLALGAQQQPRPASPHAGAFVVRLGADTIAVERFSRQGDSYSVEQVRRVPRTSLWHTHVALAPTTGDVGEIFLMNHSLERMDAPLISSTRLVAAGADSASVQMKRGDSAQSRYVVTRAGMIPVLPQSFLAYELAAMRLRKSGADSATVTLLAPSGDTTSVVVRRVGADSMVFALPAFSYRARVDADGRIQGLFQPPFGTTVTRVSAVDVNALAKSWAALDASGRAMGALSPLDSATARLGDARVSVRYSRPKSRGRTVWGGLVPWDTVWRMGANAATVLETDRDLVVGSTVVPAGRYTLFSLSSKRGTSLVISKETERGGQPLAGTEYDPAHDLARIPMTTRTLAAPVDQLTISVVPQGASGRGALRMAWGGREASVPVRVK